MPIKTSSGKWKWGNVERSSKKELVQTVYGIWKKNGSKGSFSDFLKGTHESVLNEAKADLKDKLYFHGSAFKSLYEDKTIKPPSYSRPFFITSDIHYAIAFSGHRYGGSGRVKGRGKFIDVKKERYVYVVSLNKDAEFLDFRTNEGYNEFISFFPDGLKEILKTLPRNLQHFNVSRDPFKIGVAIQELLENLYDLKIERKVANPATDDVWKHAWIRLDENAIIDKLYKELFETENILSELIKQSNSLQKIRNIGPHDLLAYVYKELDKKGYSGIIGIEEDTNEQRKAKVTTENSIGIWNVNGLDRLTTTALPVSKLYDINKYIDIDIHRGDAKKEINQKIVDLVNAMEKESNVKESVEPKDKFFKVKTNESVVSEDKAAMIKKLVLPDIEDEDEKKNYKWIIQSFFYKHPSYEKEIDWNKWKTLTKKDFDKVMDLAKTSRKARREKERMGFGKDPKELFKNVKGRKFKIVDENDSWLFVAPLNYEAAVFCDSKECGGGSATWCIGTRNNSSYWNSYISNESKFIMAFSKKFETMPEKELFSQLKYMFQKEDDAYLIWNQDDVDDDAATKVNQEKFKKSLQQLETLFSKVKDREYLTTVFIWSDEEGVLSRIFLGRKHYLKFTLPKNTEYIEDYATDDEGNQYDAEIDELVLNDSLKNIGVRAFTEISIKKISYSDNCRLDIIREEAFSRNYNIEELDLSRLKNPLTIDGYAFAYCKGLKSVKLPSNVLYLGRNIFDGCKNLRYLEIPKKFIDSSDNYKELGRICGQIDWDEIQIIPIDENGKKSTSESYEPPYTLDAIKQKYGVEAYRKLRNDPIHRFRAETGIEVIHKEPTRDEFERIVKNWDLMTPEQKKRSDEFSMKQFGKNNKDRIDNIRKSYMKKESLNEAHEIHSYPEKLQPTLERIVKDNEDYELDHAYFNKEGKFIWMRNSKGYFHVFKPVKFVKTPGMTKPFGFKDLILKDNGMLEEVDRLRFTDGNEGLKFLKDKYRLELKTIS